MSRHVLLVARAVTHHGGEATVRRLAVDVAAVVGAPVVACFLDGAAPSLHDALDAAADAGATEVLLVATHLPPDRYLDTWLRRAHADWAAGRRNPPPTSVALPLAEQPALVTAVVAAVGGPVTPLTGRPGPFRAAAWTAVPRHRHHVLVCRGPRCTAYGANDVAGALTGRLAAHGLGDDDVLVTSTGCLFPCSIGPVVVVHPDDSWYPHVDVGLAVRIVDEHLCGAGPLDGRPPRAGGTGDFADAAQVDRAED
ncbi:(2Fe-2S) ferredoxin [Micromonospora nigra]|uniref:(2Fe-2S) ferredoxin n=1 Tax=Micromonospora nigra TaxID=145857 RepID=A0A1C6R9N2_9ACTN|nr:(2Fe-2S) ferredoxin domain-containing protein [Micromonospora nigra]SCL13828.1 (2Fe-2S) ferredoxin [Micromonospora nigra]